MYENKISVRDHSAAPDVVLLTDISGNTTDHKAKDCGIDFIIYI